MWSSYQRVGPGVHQMGPTLLQKKGFGTTTVHMPDVKIADGKSFSNPNFVNPNNACVHSSKKQINIEKNSQKDKNPNQIINNMKSNPSSSDAKMEISVDNSQSQIIMMENNDSNASDKILNQINKPIVLNGLIFGCSFDIGLNDTGCAAKKCLNKVINKLRPSRERQSSVTSEDSLIIFESDGDSSYEDDLDDEDDDLDDDDYNEDEVDNETNNEEVVVCSIPSRKKVRFASDDVLCKIHPMIQWSYAYQQARSGPWERYARDAERFKARIKRTECILSPIFGLEHRTKIYENRFADNNET